MYTSNENLDMEINTISVTRSSKCEMPRDKFNKAYTRSVCWKIQDITEIKKELNKWRYTCHVYRSKC